MEEEEKTDKPINVKEFRLLQKQMNVSVLRKFPGTSFVAYKDQSNEFLILDLEIVYQHLSVKDQREFLNTLEGFLTDNVLRHNLINIKS